MKHYITVTEQATMNLVKGYIPRNKSKLKLVEKTVTRKAMIHKQSFWVKDKGKSNSKI